MNQPIKSYTTDELRQMAYDISQELILRRVNPNTIDYILDEREAKIIADLFEGRTLEAVGRDLDLTRERVRQIQNRLLQKAPNVFLDIKANLTTWELARQLVKFLDIPYSKLATRLNVSQSTVTHILMGSPQYIGGDAEYPNKRPNPKFWQRKTTFRLYIGILKLAEQKLNQLEECLLPLLRSYLQADQEKKNKTLDI